MAKVSKPTQSEQPVHLARFERVIPQGAEWRLAALDWVVLQLSEGIAYSFDRKGTTELPLGGVVICPPNSKITLTASVLGRAVFLGTAIRVNSMMGFLTALERQCLETEVAKQCAPFLVLPPEHNLSKRAAEFFAQGATLTLSSRLGFAQSFAEFVSPQLHEAMNKSAQAGPNLQDAKERLRQFISQTSESEIAKMSVGDIARILHCCERHATRLFREEWGTGFLAYVSQLRLKNACELLRDRKLKIIDVALESGHGSLSNFNYVFKKHFRMTPTEWRERQTAPSPRQSRPRLAQMAALVVCLIFGVVAVSNGFAAGTNAVPAAAASTPANSAKAAALAPAKTAPPLTFRVDRYEVRGNTLLSSNSVARLTTPFTGNAVTISNIYSALGALQTEYFQRGFVTVKVTAPPQHLSATNPVVDFDVTEGRLAAVKIVHNRFFSSNNIMRAMPYVKSLASGKRILNSKIFQAELDRANTDPDRQIAPEVRPGLDPGTSALILDVKDRLPLHGRVDFDNYSPPGTPELRDNVNVSYGNLWQLDHTLGLQYGASPDTQKLTLGEGTHQSYTALDAPDVAYYSGFYRAPFGAQVGVENQIAQNPNSFGYNETTKQFIQPPPSGRPEFTAYASRSTTGPTMYGPKSVIVGGSATNILTVEKQLISQQYTAQSTVGARLSFPLPSWEKIQSSWSFGIDYKDDKLVTLPTNYFLYTTIVKNGDNPNAPPTITQTSLAIPGVATYPELNYTPLFLGWNGSREDHWLEFAPSSDVSSRLDGSLAVVAGTGGVFSKNKAFTSLIAGSGEATTEFVAVRPGLSRTQVLPGNFSFFGNLVGQWANEPLLNLEQFELGGNASVRGYREGELYSDTGWFSQAEFRSPVYWRGASGLKVGTQLTAFTDYGQGYNRDIVAGEPPEQSLWGAGMGANFHFGAFVESHALVAWPLINSAFSTAGRARFFFSLSAQL